MNASNFAGHIWDVRDGDGHMGATACVVVPRFWDRYQNDGDWQRLAWWIHDHVPYSNLFFFPRYWAFNITWHERPERRIDSYVSPKGCLTRPGMATNEADNSAKWRGVVEACRAV